MLSVAAASFLLKLKALGVPSEADKITLAPPEQPDTTDPS